MLTSQQYQDIAIIHEKFFANSKNVENIVKNTKSLSYSEFIKKLKAGDVLIVYPKWSKMSMIARLRYLGNSRVQGSSFSSIKMYVGNSKVIGYGVNFKTPTQLSEITINKALSQYEGIICVRHKKATAKQIKDVVEYMKEKYKEQTPYDSRAAFSSVFSHFINGENTKQNNIHEKFFKIDAEKFSGMLFCSTVINLAYISAGLKTGMNNISALHVWPIDFLTSTEFEPMFKYFTKEAELDDKGKERAK